VNAESNTGDAGLTVPWTRHPLIWLGGLALVLRLLTLPFSLGFDFDVYAYRGIAANLVAGKGFTLEGFRPETYWPPGAVWLHALCLLVNSSPMVYRLLWVILSAACVPPAFCLAKQMFGGRVAWVFGFLMAVYPYNLMWTMSASTEIPNLLLLLTAAWLIARRGSPFGIGVAFGLACLCRPSDLSFLPLLLVWVVWSRRHETSRAVFHRGRMAAAGLFLCGALLCIGPWSARNSCLAGTFVPLCTGGVRNVWLGTNPWYIAWQRGEMDGKEYGAKVYPDNIWTMSYAEQNRYCSRAVLDFATSQPQAFAGVMVYKTIRFFLSPPGWNSAQQVNALRSRLGGHGREAAFYLGFIYLPVIGGALAAVALAFRQRRWRRVGPVIVWVVFAYASNVWFDAVVAYRYKSGTEVALLLLAAWFVASQQWLPWAAWLPGAPAPEGPNPAVKTA
jgi:Dolichyl-phosphate-mannose-protein mannosyltransferase